MLAYLGLDQYARPQFCRLVPPYDPGHARVGHVDGRLCKGATRFCGKAVRPDSPVPHGADRAGSPPPAWPTPLSSCSQCESRAGLVVVASLPTSQSQCLSCQTSPQFQLAVRHASSAENTPQRRDSRRELLRSSSPPSATPGSLSSRQAPWKCPCSPDNLPRSVLVVPTMSLETDWVFFDPVSFPRKEFDHDPSDSNSLLCKRYHNRGPLATQKVSHFPQESAMLERKFKRAEGKKGVSRGTSRRNSHLGVDPGQQPTCSRPALWALT